MERIVVIGESLGAAAAVGLARDAEVHDVVLRSPFTSLADVGRVHYPFLPVRLLLRDRFDVVGAVRDAHAPIVGALSDATLRTSLRVPDPRRKRPRWKT